MRLPGLPEKKPTCEELFGFDPNAFVGGHIVGSDHSYSIDPQTHMELSSRITNIEIVRGTGDYMIEFSYEDPGDGRLSSIAGNVQYAQISKGTDGSLDVYIPHVGEFTVLPPRQVSDRRIKSVIHGIRSREMFQNN